MASSPFIPPDFGFKIIMQKFQEQDWWLVGHICTVSNCHCKCLSVLRLLWCRQSVLCLWPSRVHSSGLMASVAPFRETPSLRTAYDPTEWLLCLCSLQTPSRHLAGEPRGPVLGTPPPACLTLLPWAWISSKCSRMPCLLRQARHSLHTILTSENAMAPSFLINSRTTFKTYLNFHLLWGALPRSLGPTGPIQFIGCVSNTLCCRYHLYMTFLWILSLKTRLKPILVPTTSNNCLEHSDFFGWKHLQD